MTITNHSIEEFLNLIDEPRKSEISEILKVMKEVSGLEPKLWGSIIGFGNLYYKYPTGTHGNMPLLGIANRKSSITLYVTYVAADYPELANLGKYEMGKSCIYVKKLSDINLDVLKKIMLRTKELTKTIDYLKIIE